MAAALPDRFSAGKRQFWREFLALYQGMPELWDLQHVNYRNKELRNRAYESLERKLREIQPNATRTEVGRRINIFRTNYRREQMRIIKLKELGMHSDLCKPTLWFYDYMGFLLTQETFQHRTRKGRGDKQKQVYQREKDEKCNLKNADLNTDSVCDWPMKDDNTNTPQSEEGSLLSPKVEIIEPEDEDPTMGMEQVFVKEETCVVHPLENKQNTCSIQPEPENERETVKTILSESSEVLARSWAIQYEEMAPTQRILARKAIADILFEGCMGNLRINRGDQRSTVGNHV
ncbi:uncharacterized protein LOC108104624 [Drosophila eugracilis]|uniref:uncharacterized protein LOC108104624 n=1 Tax=Drosophila eugracilis TaxID=29029 RepID=UPI0007E750E8|nr:uncharacterized protein LOC108104624 [Drosophila eugracilis]XP_017066287.1 uncharacterized protein LOC108104624 [Drosophila eugracilis]XP_017066288.1 uncharacterized protein LOC108104624 [Drosophila eugracilis]